MFASMFRILVIVTVIFLQALAKDVTFSLPLAHMFLQVVFFGIIVSIMTIKQNFQLKV